MSVRALRRGTMAGRGAAAPSTTNTLYLPGTSGNYASRASTNPISTGLDFRMKLSVPVWTSGVYALIDKFNSSGQSSYRWELLNGTLRLITYHGSPNSPNSAKSATTTLSGWGDDSVHWVRTAWRNSDGLVQHFKSDDGSSWTQVGTDLTGSTSTVYAGTRDIEIGGYESGTQLPLNGNVYYAEMRDSPDGTVVLSFDATAVTKLGTRSPTSVAAGGTSGGTWSINGAAWDWEAV